LRNPEDLGEKLLELFELAVDRMAEAEKGLAEARSIYDNCAETLRRRAEWLALYNKLVS
jgi:hypothetical protein